MNNIEERSMLPIGTLLQRGKYRIERYLSSGGFGNTYVATNTEFEEQVAIKEFFMRGISQRDGDSVSVSVSNQTNLNQFISQKEKFRKEARRLRKLRNNHIVAVHDLFEENGTAYYEMDLIKGESLSERLKRTGMPIVEAEVLQILLQVLDALAVVHAQGLFHLDLKPGNIMVDQTGRALLIDFGASKQLSANGKYSISTSSSMAFTPGFAPLEQMEQNLKSFGPWTDLYALGATLYKLLTNLTPPSASELLVSRTPLMFPIPVSTLMQQLIAWMMKPAYVDRPQNVEAVRSFLEGRPIDDETAMVEKPNPEEPEQPGESEEPKQPEESEEPEQPEESEEPEQPGESEEPKQPEEPEQPEESEEPKQPEEPEQPEEPKQPEEPEQPHRSSKIWWGVGTGVAAAVVAAVVVSLLMLKGPSTSDVISDSDQALQTENPQKPVSSSRVQQVIDQSFTSPVINGMGKYQYTGPVDDQGRPDGIGKAVFSNGDSYEGPFEKGVMSGNGACYIYKSGALFKGEMRNDQFLKGTYTHKDGRCFTGSFRMGQPEHGTWYDRNGKKLSTI